MARKGGKNHIKSLNAPMFYMVKRKETKYIAKPSPGRHTLESSISLRSFVKMAGLAGTNAEVGRMINSGSLKVNGRKVSDDKYPVGINDTVWAEEIGKYYRIGVDTKGHISYKEVGKDDASARFCKVVNKYVGAGGKLMVTLNDGTTIEAPEGVKVKDSLHVGNGKPKVYSFKEGSKCFVMDGVHVGVSGTIKSINMKDKSIKSVTVESGGAEFETLAKNVMVVG